MILEPPFEYQQFFEGMVTQIYPNELQLNKTNSTITEAAFLDLHLLISNGFVLF